MNKTEFTNRVIKHIKTLGLNPADGGTWREKGTYPHILNLKNMSQIEAIKKFGLINNAKDLPFLYETQKGKESIKLHSYAHHLNSSQIMCYNLFRPLVTDECKAKPKLIELFQSFCPNLRENDDTLARFEYEEKGEKTNFDFCVISGSVKIFCEIKYTEGDFGKKCKASNCNHYKKVYKKMVDVCEHLWKKNVDENDFMNKYFQLFRNSIRAKTENDYVLFICPKERTDLERSFNNFKNEYIKDDCRNIKYVTWEMLVQEAEQLSIDVSEFKERYLNI